ncbi:glutathione S-transferase family protein [Asticcacaulis sp. AND118]|uniref:glutathione S-transferase family protein n=1 Tax=Asticcacaulis sp. AND118 TaxID=2840468 RepID=UPI001CFF5D65|nr:glutathione S-transferase [Asticcacaulis sp. AND118]UDF02456.1 glutathione S-transferase [Asticcacaulis sp. AND118]
MITVHHLNNSRSQRVLWLLEELGLNYEIVRYERDPSMFAPPELRAIHPLGKSPVITDDGLTVAETGAIVEYLLETYGAGRLVPSDPKARQQMRYWLHYAEGSAMPLLLLKLVASQIPARVPALIRPIASLISKGLDAKMVAPGLKTHLAFWEASLKETGWFAGDALSAADIMMSFPVEAAVSRAGAADRPVLKAFIERIHARDAYQRALARGGPYAYA